MFYLEVKELEGVKGVEKVNAMCFVDRHRKC